MRILFILNNLQEENVYRNFLSTIAEADSIYFVYSYDNAEDFVKNRIIKDQEQLDLIILTESDYSITAERFKKFIENDLTITYSKRDFNLSKIPIFVLLNQSKDKESYLKIGFSDVVFDFGADNFHKYSSNIVTVIKRWRRLVIDDLDNIGIKFNEGIINYDYFFKKSFTAKNPTIILSENFKQFPRKLSYYWLQNNKKQIEEAIDEFLKLLKRSNIKNKKQEELKYHKFFNRNPIFLQRDRYSRTWHEAKLKRDGTRHYDPDFTLRPNFNFKTDLSLIEVKLPNEGFLKSNEFHQTFLSKVFGHLGQVNDYKDYLEDNNYKNNINQQFGFVPKSVEYNLLIGRFSDKQENIYNIEKRMRQFSQNHINLMTYDELLDYQVKFLDRMNLLEIK